MTEEADWTLAANHHWLDQQALVVRNPLSNELWCWSYLSAGSLGVMRDGIVEERYTGSVDGLQREYVLASHAWLEPSTDRFRLAFTQRSGVNPPNFRLFEAQDDAFVEIAVDKPQSVTRPGARLNA